MRVNPLSLGFRLPLPCNRSKTVFESDKNIKVPQALSTSLIGLGYARAENYIQKLKNIASDIQALVSINNVLMWDTDLNLPKEGPMGRAWQVATVTKLIHEKLTQEGTKKILDFFSSEDSLYGLDKIERALVKEIKSQYEREKNVPSSLLEKLVLATSNARKNYLKAYSANDFKIFAPALENLISIKRQIAEHAGYKDSPYDYLLDYYEPGITTKELDAIFEKLKKELVPLLALIKDSPIKIEPHFLKKDYPLDKQLTVVKELLEHIGFDFSKGRVDAFDNSYSLGILPEDVRLVVCISENNIYQTTSIVLHEGGHGLYDLGIDPSLYKTPLYDGASTGIHESQSKLYEVLIGQNLPFWKFYFPKLKEKFPNELKDVSLEDFYNAINCVFFTPFWGESDEITSNIHIMVRYEIEKELIEGKLRVEDVPKAWNNKMKDYLGILPRSDVEGPLQSDYWANNDIGYYPTYMLGSLYAAQIYNTAKKEIPDLEDRITNGDLLVLREWLKEKIHKYGKVETPKEIIKRVTGEPLNPEHFIKYIKEKYSKLYSINLKNV